MISSICPFLDFRFSVHLAVKKKCFTFFLNENKSLKLKLDASSFPLSVVSRNEGSEVMKSVSDGITVKNLIEDDLNLRYPDSYQTPSGENEQNGMFTGNQGPVGPLRLGRHQTWKAVGRHLHYDR